MFQWFSNALGKALIASDTNPVPIYFPGGAAITLATFPAAANSTGTAGSIAYSNGYGALCVATNTWVFWPTSGTYPF